MSIGPDKEIPKNIEAEEALLGSLLIDPDVMTHVANLVDPEDFYLARHGEIYDVIRTLYDRGNPVDFVTLTEELDRRGKLEEVGGHSFISSLVNAVPTAINAYQYAQIVQEKATLRHLISAAGDIARKAYDDEQDVGDVVNEAEKLIFAIAERRLEQDLVAITDVVPKVLEDIRELMERRGEVLGVPSGFHQLDELLGGFQKSDLIILAARPGMGKTSLALNIALNAAKGHGSRVAVFSLEMSREQLVQRLLSQEAQIDSQSLRLGHLKNEGEWALLEEAAEVLRACRIFIDDTAALSPFELRTKARRLYAEHGLDMVIVDYMQLMHGGKRSENRVQEISFISRTMKQLARELRVPVIALSQLSRDIEKRADKHPVLSDLRESGSIEQDADLVIFIYREKKSEEESERSQIAKIMVAKHRHGPTGAVELFFDERHTQFTQLRKQPLD
ncbi:MAG: replicative DNA helicase [Clostridia bacterium]|nr:MAG: replicative DNA helicase [Clostridia bacterium]